jgi:hypothetical protein
MAKAFEWLEPGYVPKGFKRIGAVEGVDAGEFWGATDQIAVRYRRRSSQHPPYLTVCWTADSGQVLTGTDQRAGVPVDVKGNRGAYHDGAWAPGPGDEQVDTPVGPLHWDRQLVHSLTMRTDDGVFAVSGLRDEVPVGELVKIMSTIPAI